MPPAQRLFQKTPAIRGVRLKPGTVAAVLFLFVAGLVLAYVGGVMSGRAHWHPKEAETVVEEAQSEENTAPVEVLDPSDLRYAVALRTHPGMVAPSPSPAPTNEKVPQQPAMPVGMRPAVPPGQKPPPPVRPSTPATIFDYVFQVAAFKDMESVDDIRQRLEGRGYRTRMERRGRLYVIYLLLQGDARQAGKVPATLKSLRLGEPILRSKKPVR